MTDSGSTSQRPEETGSSHSAQGTTGTPIGARSAVTVTQQSTAASRSEAAQSVDDGQAMDPTVTATVIGLLSATVLLLVIVVVIQAVTRRKTSRRCCYCRRFRREASENEDLGGANSSWQDKAHGCPAARVLGSNEAYHHGEIAVTCGHHPTGGSSSSDRKCSTAATPVTPAIDDAGYGSVSSLPPSRGDACSCSCSARGHGDGGSIDDASLQPSPQQGTGRRQLSFSHQHIISDTGTIRAAVAQMHSLHQQQQREPASASAGGYAGRARAASISMTGNGYWSSSTLPGTTTTAAASAGRRSRARQAHSVGFAGTGSSGCCCQHACTADDCGPAGGAVQTHRSLFAALRARRNSKIGQVEVAIENDGASAAGVTVASPQPNGYHTASGETSRQDDICIDIGKVRSMDEVLLILSRQDMSDRYLGSSNNGCNIGSATGSTQHQATPHAAPTSQEIYVFPVPDEPSSDSEQSESAADHNGTPAPAAAGLQLVQQGRYIVLGSSAPGESQL